MDDATGTRLKRINREFLDGHTDAALKSDRKRVHHNLHPELEDPVQRMCVAMEPGSYFRPHRHTESGRWELFVALKGAAAVILFDERGIVTEKAELRASGETLLVEIPPGTWHTLCVLEPDTVLFESKPGPYVPLSDKDFASWAPAEGSPEARRFEAWFLTAQPGDKPPPL